MVVVTVKLVLVRCDLTAVMDPAGSSDGSISDGSSRQQ